MAVFTPIALALWRFQPRLRVAYVGFLLLLGFALVATGYHFLSDVVAGACLGWLIDLAANRILFLFLGESGCATKVHSHELENP
jgi:membrane-associated phospholipid phosphatase